MTSIGSSKADRFAEIDRCLAMISPSSSDESKFVGMLILPKLLQQNDAAAIQHVFDGMNFTFIERLLRTAPDENAEVPDSVMKEIAVNILGCFARYENLVTSKPMTERIPTLSTVLTPNDPTDVTEETLHIMLCMAVTKESMVKILDPDVLKNIFEVFAQTQKAKERSLCVQLVTSVYARACHQLHEKPIPSLTSAVKYSLKTTLSILSQIFKNDQDMLKFETLHMLSQLLPLVPSTVMDKVKHDAEKSYGRWLEHLRVGLRQLLSSRLRDSDRDEAMVVTACMLRYFGPDWLFSSLEQTKACKRKKEKQSEDKKVLEAYADANFPSLLVHLSAVETRVMLDDINDRLRSLHNLNAVVHDEEKERRQEIMIPVHYEILEACIQYLSMHFDNDSNSGTDPEVLLKIRKTLSDTLEIVMELLRFIQDTTDNDEELENNTIAQASMRIVAVWLAEEGFEL
ncbi:Neurochondrin-domain-containing protein [Radiomyces spectabilis]|uniref:Neurochondrin-domain-containing protein n=1 Tax=Radiomyces spectabilis TaxID=64574 RepID=UPI0022207590|nr:Neurochondrin-domain-containing protein [Radiomyces spectabilis]KAI8390961.1 Neurochondrin-domain-containing protein [Radiomyces spectabilis]